MKWRTRVGLAGYVRTGPPLGSLLAAVCLLPFWLSSEIAQADWSEAQKLIAIATLWGVLLGGLGFLAAQAPQQEEAVVATESPTPSALSEQPTATPTSSPLTVTPTPAPLTAPPTPPLATTDLGLVIADERRAGYDRDHFGDWIDADSDGCNTREEVLIAESLDPVTVGPGCELSGGRWYSAYDGRETTDPSTFDIDHFVPVAEAWDSGAYAWSSSNRRAFYNDLDYAGSLIAVTAGSNRSKSDRDPAQWRPPLSSYHCTYAQTWLAVKRRWSLTADQIEANALRQMLSTCA